MNKTFSAALSVALICTTSLHAQTINTIGGTGVAGYTGDGGPALAAELRYPNSLAKDSVGNIYFTEQINNTVRKITPSGIITTVAGTGTSGYNGDEIPATTAQLKGPEALAFDREGNLYICEYLGSRVRKIDQAGVIHTFVGNGFPGSTGDGGPASLAQVYGPAGIAFDKDDNALIVDEAAQIIRKVDGAGIITKFAGVQTANLGDGGLADTASLFRPRSIAIDKIGNIYIADINHYRIRKIDTNKIITTVAGNGTQGYSGDGGQATSAMLNTASDITVDSLGNLYIVDVNNNRIRRVDPLGIIKTIAGTGNQGFSGDGGEAILADFSHPGAVLIANNAIYIADHDNHRIRAMGIPLRASVVRGLTNYIELFPNANNGSFTLSGSLLTKESTVQITISDLTGKIVLNDEAHVQNGHINKQVKLSSTAPAGNYLLTITTDQGTTTLKFEKK